MFFIMVIWLGAIGWLFRELLVLGGWHKGPVLALFEVYGGEAPMYYPLPVILLCIGVIIWCGEMVVSGTDNYQPGAFGITGILFLVLAWIAWHFAEHVRSHIDFMLVLPIWYAKLRENTTRSEQRRLAYMWLRLPLRTRLLYNASDHYFFLWADLVIAASVRDI
jgi:hypothetical protein